MPATPRDLLKPRAQRLSEIYQSVQLQASQSNSQQVAFGCVLAPGGTTSQLAISAGEFVINQSVVAFAAVTGQNITSGQSVWTANPTNTSAGQVCYVLVEADASSVLYLTQSPITTGTPVLPALTASRIALGYLSIPASFTFGTTALTTNICKQVSYDAGNVNPSGTQSTTGSSGGF